LFGPCHVIDVKQPSAKRIVQLIGTCNLNAAAYEKTLLKIQTKLNKYVGAMGLDQTKHEVAST